MKEKIYTIPINESYEQDSECPFCYIERKLEKEAVEYALGPAMMEPDYRIISNEKGYCNKHFSMMLAFPNKLSLALVLETHLKEVIDNLEKHRNKVNTPEKSHGKFFKKRSADSPLMQMMSDAANSQKKCVICEKIDDTLKRYIEVFFYMWEKDDELRKKVEASKGFCLKHFTKLCNDAYSNLKNPDEFVRSVYNLELENLNRISDDIHHFTLKFDYRNKDMEWGAAIDAPVRTIEKLRGYSIPIKEESN